MAGDTKEWRTHLEQAKKYGEVPFFFSKAHSVAGQGVPTGGAEQAGKDLGRALQAPREDLWQRKGH